MTVPVNTTGSVKQPSRLRTYLSKHTTGSGTVFIMNSRQQSVEDLYDWSVPFEDILYLGTKHEGVLVEINAMCVMAMLYSQEVVKVIKRKEQLRCEGCFHGISHHHTCHIPDAEGLLDHYFADVKDSIPEAVILKPFKEIIRRDYPSHLKWLDTFFWITDANARYRKLTQEGWDQQIRRVAVQLLEAS